MRALKDWFKKYHDSENPLVMILPDFESFPTNVLHDFILVLRYSDVTDRGTVGERTQLGKAPAKMSVLRSQKINYLNSCA